MSKGNTRFAVDLYKHLSAAEDGKNLFFSPYSISSALTMTAEGARGQTALEMGRVLHFPEEARNPEGTTAPRPWNTALIHSSFEKINRILLGKDLDSETRAIRTNLTGLREELDRAKEATRKAQAAHDWNQVDRCVRTERVLVEKINGLAAKVDQFELNVANAIWAEKTCPLEAPFVKTVNHYYKTAGVQPADFRNNADGERQRINDWVEKKTKERIQELIPTGMLLPATRLVLVNAIYFRGEWETPFVAGKTETADFFLPGNGTVKVKMMRAHALAPARYGAFNGDGTFFNTPRKVPWEEEAQQPPRYPDAGFAMAELPYKGKAVSMVLLVPTDPNGLGAIESILSATNLTAWLGHLDSREIHLNLPRFKLETDYELNKTLPSMGMKQAFTPPGTEKGADFTGIHKPETAEEGLFISKVLHKAFLEVNEKGTEAAAATAVMMEAGAAAPDRVPFVPTLNADRPFLLLIRHNQSGAILFMGRVMKP